MPKKQVSTSFFLGAVFLLKYDSRKKLMDILYYPNKASIIIVFHFLFFLPRFIG
ncbi:hypothetical protein BY458DRAFT_530030 [Sporodiniella umbellata]|nr:hypothetical protein BY458DRAFT_530030 [Sporodiniella umbellata]